MNKVTGRLVDGILCMLYHTEENTYMFDLKDGSFIGVLRTEKKAAPTVMVTGMVVNKIPCAVYKLSNGGRIAVNLKTNCFVKMW